MFLYILYYDFSILKKIIENIYQHKYYVVNTFIPFLEMENVYLYHYWTHKVNRKLQVYSTDEFLKSVGIKRIVLQMKTSIKSRSKKQWKLISTRKYWWESTAALAIHFGRKMPEKKLMLRLKYKLVIPPLVWMKWELLLFMRNEKLYKLLRESATIQIESFINF